MKKYNVLENKYVNRVEFNGEEYVPINTIERHVVNTDVTLDEARDLLSYHTKIEVQSHRANKAWFTIEVDGEAVSEECPF